MYQKHFKTELGSYVYTKDIDGSIKVESVGPKVARLATPVAPIVPEPKAPEAPVEQPVEAPVEAPPAEEPPAEPSKADDDHGRRRRR